jgi:hypothetical protein
MQRFVILGWGISQTQQHKHTIKTDEHPCLEWDLNPFHGTATQSVLNIFTHIQISVFMRYRTRIELPNEPR